MKRSCHKPFLSALVKVTLKGIGAVLFFTILLQGCKPEKANDGYEAGEENSGGATTIFDFSENAFNHSAPNISNDEETKFSVGNSFFRQNWVIAPSSTAGRDGLGPLYNALGCSGCHLKDGRGRAPMPGEGVTGFLFRLSTNGTDAHGGPAGDAIYGGQFQTLSIPGVQNEGSFTISYQTINGTYQDGTTYSLQQPTYNLNGNYGSLSNLLVSPRVAPQMSGLGLLAAINESELIARADEGDANGDGISGRANYVWDYKNQTLAFGRFGWKANQPNLFQQTAGAFNGDVGITSSLFPTDHCTSAQQDCLNAINGNDSAYNYELSDYQLDRVAYYSATLAVPGRRNAKDATVLAGKKLFTDAGCAKCHVPSYTTGTDPAIAAVSNQKIYPYTDLLLHDMGAALADNRPDYLASGSEWRTPPLWGIGLFLTVNGHTNYLHDGRARNLAEAILWHGGEADNAKEYFKKLNNTEREALIQFLQSL
jgi:CxxC motif-containing protein (DUF1111 family)